MNKNYFILLACVVMLFFNYSISEANQTISIKGFAYSIEQPDIAHIVIKVHVGADS